MSNFVFMRDLNKEFIKIYDENIEKIYRFVFLKVGSQEAAEDLSSQVFVKGWDKFRTGKGEIQNPSAYLFQIARNEIADYYRKRKFNTVSIEDYQLSDPNLKVEQDFSQKSDLEIIKAKLTSLSEDHQNVLILRYLNDFSIKEIAKILEKQEGAVRVMIHRAIQELKEKMNGGQKS